MPSSLFKRFRPNGGWKTTRSSTSSESRRGAHVVLGARATAVALSAFSLNDLFTGRTIEAAQSAILALFFIALGARLPRRINPTTLARLGLLAALVMISYESAIGANEGFTFLWLYVLPLGSFFALGRREGLVWWCATTAVLIWLLFMVEPRVTPDGAVGNIAFATFVLLGLLGYGLESARDRQAQLLEQEKSQLQQALSDLESLYGLVPICASCKSVRDDRGYWHDIETYLSKHSAVELKSALCPDCLDATDMLPASEEVGSSQTFVQTVPQPGFGSSGHRRRRRIYFTAGMSVLVPFAGYFASIDLRAGRYFEAGLVGALLALFIGICSLLWATRESGRWDRATYQLAAAGSLLVLVYEIWIGAYGGYVVLWLYSFPAIGIFVLGRRGLEWSLASFGAAAILLLAPLGFAYPAAMSGRFLVTLGLVILLTFSLETARKRSHGQLAKESAALRETLDQVQTLRGMLPICPSCKKVRDDQGFWQQIETHMTRVSSARFTHGLCPTCGERALAELEDMRRLGITS